MSMIAAGALAGAGEGINKWLEDNRKLAHDLMKKEADEKRYRDRIEWAAEFKGKSRAGRRGLAPAGGGGKPGSGPLPSLSNSDEVRIEAAYRNRFSDGIPGEDVPTLPDFKLRVRQMMADQGIPRSEAEAAAINDWGDIQGTETKERGWLGKMWHGEDTYEEPTTRQGFRGLAPKEPDTGADTAPPPAAASPAAEAPPAPRDPAQRKVGMVYSAPDGRKVRWTGEGWEVLNG